MNHDALVHPKSMNMDCIELVYVPSEKPGKTDGQEELVLPGKIVTQISLIVYLQAVPFKG